MKPWIVMLPMWLGCSQHDIFAFSHLNIWPNFNWIDHNMYLVFIESALCSIVGYLVSPNEHSRVKNTTFNLYLRQVSTGNN